MRPSTRVTLTSSERAWASPDKRGSQRTRAVVQEIASAEHEANEPIRRLLCEVCGDVIGVYEPLVMRTTESERTTSRAAEPELRARDGAYFHHECHALAAV
jgi:hypothetical protein